jgi:hypothetical protein
MENRQLHVEQRIQVLRDLLQRIRGIPSMAARQEADAIERELVKLREERRALDAPSLVRGTTLRGLGRSRPMPDTDDAE